MHVFLVAVLLIGQATSSSLPLQGQPRDPGLKPVVGTGTISGRVVASDTGAPLRRAQVMLSGSQQPKMANTDHEGRYVFRNLPAATYTVTANPGTHRGSYLPGAYGASTSVTPGMPMARGKPVKLADGQTIENIDIVIGRGGAISGTVTDAAGEPAARVQVGAMLMRRGFDPMILNNVSTDDLGQFRLFGLAPGEYVVHAEARGGGFGYMDVQGEAIGFTTTYAPGTGSLTEAVRVRLTRGGQATIDIRLIETRVYTIRGTVVSSTGEQLRNANVSISRVETMPMTGSYGTSVMPDGTFTIRNVAPGHYEIMARYTPAQEGPTPNPQAMERTEMATARIDVGAGDIEGITLVTQRGAVVSGQIVFEDGQTEGRRVQVSAMPAERRFYIGPPTAEVKDATFTLKNMFGRVVIRGNASAAIRPADGARESFGLKAVLFNGKDITDEPREFTNADSGKLQLVFTTHAPALEGTVTDEAGKPVQEYTVLLFGDDPATWLPNSSMIRTTRPMPDAGKFQFRGLREGRYRVVALPHDFMMNTMRPDQQMLEALSKVATAVLLNAGETRALELKLTPFEQ